MYYTGSAAQRLLRPFRAVWPRAVRSSSYLSNLINCDEVSVVKLDNVKFRPILLYSEEKRAQVMDSWMKDKGKYSKEEIEKLEKGSGFIKAWTLLCNWIYRVVSW